MWCEEGTAWSPWKGAGVRRGQPLEGRGCEQETAWSPWKGAWCEEGTAWMQTELVPGAVPGTQAELVAWMQTELVPGLYWACTFL